MAGAGVCGTGRQTAEDRSNEWIGGSRCRAPCAFARVIKECYELGKSGECVDGAFSKEERFISEHSRLARKVGGEEHNRSKKEEAGAVRIYHMENLEISPD